MLNSAISEHPLDIVAQKDREPKTELKWWEKLKKGDKFMTSDNRINELKDVRLHKFSDEVCLINTYHNSHQIRYCSPYIELKPFSEECEEFFKEYTFSEKTKEQIQKMIDKLKEYEENTTKI